MRKIIWNMHVSLDGFIAGPNGEIDWIYLNDEIFEDGHAVIKTADTALYGRKTFEVMKSYWPTATKNPNATKHDIDHANWVNPALKLVVSKSLKEPGWQNTRIIKENVPAEIAKLQKQPGKNIMLFASPTLASTLTNHDLIDEYWFNVSPIILGRGKPLFQDTTNVRKLKLVGSKAYENGVVNLHYSRT
jgi:dihydrofolate reductase